MKTKRFLFYTGGTDSTLLLTMLIRALEDYTDDELVIILVMNDTMGSGQQNKVEEAISVLGNTLPLFGLEESVLQRISITIPNTTFILTGKEIELQIDTKATTKLSVLQQSPYIKSMGKNLCAQELILLSIVPTLIGFLGECKNTFYLGSCGNDIATRTTDKLKQIFNLTFDVAFMRMDSNTLENELDAIEAFPAMFKRNSIKKEYIPTLEFPLQNISKDEVLMLLDEYKVNTYHVAKTEDLLKYYSHTNDFLLDIYISIYHEITKDYRSDQVTSLKEFFTSNTISVNGKEVVSPDNIMNIVSQHSLKLLGRIKL